jgi:hypothetical protein
MCPVLFYVSLYFTKFRNYDPKLCSSHVFQIAKPIYSQKYWLTLYQVLIIRKKNTKCCIYFDIHGSVHHKTIPIKMINKMQLCRIIYYSIVPWLLYMFRAILSLIIRSILTVITASGFIHMCCCRLLSWTTVQPFPVKCAKTDKTIV